MHLSALGFDEGIWRAELLVDVMRDLRIPLSRGGIRVAMPYRKHSQALEIILSKIRACEQKVRRTMSELVC